jgi:hypothetical protein
MPTNNYMIVWDPTNKKWTAREDGGAAYDLVENSTAETQQFNEIAAPGASGAGESMLYMDSTSKLLNLSQNAGGYGPIAPLTTKGDLMGFSTLAARLAVGGDGTILEADSGQALGIKWGSKFSSPLTTKGDLFGYSTVDARVAIGTNHYILVPDSAQSLGLKWWRPPYCELYRSGSFTTATGAWGTITWNATTSDNDSMHPGSSEYITVPVAGRYHVVVSVDVVERDARYLILVTPSSGAAQICSISGSSKNGVIYPRFSGIFNLPASGTVYCQVHQNTGGTRTWCASTPYSRIWVQWLGPA